MPRKREVFLRVVQTQDMPREDRQVRAALRSLGLGRKGSTVVVPNDARSNGLARQCGEFVKARKVYG